MKYLKMLGLAVVAAAALLAFVGAGSASATVLCKSTPTASDGTCTEDYAAGTTVHAVLKAGKEAILNEGLSTEVRCKQSTVHGLTSNTGSATETVSGNLTTTGTPPTGLTFGECTQDVTVLNPGSLEIHWIAKTENGTLTSSGARVTVQYTALGIHCIYTTNNTHIGELKGGSPATLVANATIGREATSFLCPTSSTWNAEYEVTSPKPLYIGSAKE